jgi:hypothetical protein
MAVVPIREQSQTQDRAGVQPAPPMPPDTFLLMAAAQMHSEGRLVADSGDKPPPSPAKPVS